jgi:hypothetical protein
MCAPLSPFELNLVHGNRQNRSKCHRKLPKGPFAQISDKKRPSTESSWIVFNLFQKQKNCLSISQNGAYTLRNVPTKKKKRKAILCILLPELHSSIKLHKLMTTICLLSRAPGSVVVLIAFIHILSYRNRFPLLKKKTGKKMVLFR